MPHQRQLIRQAVKDLLLGATDAGERVYPTRKHPLRKVELPVVLVYTLEDEVDSGESSAPRELTRNLAVTVEGWVAPGANVDDAMDELALQIETALHADPFWGGVVGAHGAMLGVTDMAVIDQGDREIGWISLTYEATYYTAAPEATADADLDDFRTVATTTNLAGEQDEADQFEDEFTVQEAEA